MVAEPLAARLRVAMLVSALALGGCSESTEPEPERVPPLPESLLFVSGPAGNAQIQRWYPDSVVAVTAGPGENSEPSSAAGHLVFTSYRDGNSEIYAAKLDGTGQHRIITSSAFDNQADLSPDARRIVFVSTRSGTQRLYVADSSGANLAPLSTGSATNSAETSPVWSADGQRIAFASSRTGTSQIFIVPAAGGAAEQLTHESVGAFDPAWSANGDTIFYVSAGASTDIRAIRIASGGSLGFPSAPGGYGQPACASFGCIAIRAPYGSLPDLVALQRNGRLVTELAAGAAGMRDPTLIRP